MDSLQAINKYCQRGKMSVLLCWLYVHLFSGCHSEFPSDLRGQVERLREQQYAHLNLLHSGLNLALCRNDIADEIHNLYENATRNMQTEDVNLSVHLTTSKSKIDLVGLAEMSRYLIFYGVAGPEDKFISRSRRLFSSPNPFVTTFNIMIVPTAKTSIADLIKLYQQVSGYREDITRGLNHSHVREITAIWIYQMPENHTLFIKERESLNKLKGSISVSVAETLYRGVRPIWIVRTECQASQRNASKKPGIDLLIRE